MSSEEEIAERILTAGSIAKEGLDKILASMEEEFSRLPDEKREHVMNLKKYTEDVFIAHYHFYHTQADTKSANEVYMKWKTYMEEVKNEDPEIAGFIDEFVKFVVSIVKLIAKKDRKLVV